jgi:hypothetical protein
VQLSDDQLLTIETFGGLNYPPDKIVMILNVNPGDFFADFNLIDSDPAYLPGQIRYHYDRGQLLAQAEIDKANLKRAKEGNLTSIAQYKKDIIHRDIQNVKKRTVYHREKTYLEEVRVMIEHGNSANLAPVQVQYIEQIDFIRGLQLQWSSKPFIISAVRSRWPNISKYQITALYNDTLNFFYHENEIKLDAWKNFYAEKLDNLAALAVEMNDLEQCRRCLAEAADIRGVKKEIPREIPAEMLDRRTVVYTQDIEKLGIPKINQHDLAIFIEGLALSASEKLKIRRDSQIEDTPFELLTDDQEEV